MAQIIPIKFYAIGAKMPSSLNLQKNFKKATSFLVPDYRHTAALKICGFVFAYHQITNFISKYFYKKNNWSQKFKKNGTHNS